MSIAITADDIKAAFTHLVAAETTAESKETAPNKQNNIKNSMIKKKKNVVTLNFYIEQEVLRYFFAAGNKRSHTSHKEHPFLPFSFEPSHSMTFLVQLEESSLLAETTYLQQPADN